MVALVAVLLLAGCTDDAEPGDAATPSPTRSIYTLTPLPQPPEPPPSGTLIADLRQSSRDGALNRFEVWIDNDTDAAVTPTRVAYRDGRYLDVLPGTRLREIPAQSERGFPIYQPDQPACGSGATSGEVTVDYTVGGEERSVTVPVDDETDVAGRYAASRCLELAVEQVATLSWADEVPLDPSTGEASGEGSTGTLTLQIATSGQPGHTLVIDSIRGTPVLNAAGADAWSPGLEITGDQPSTTLALPLKPTRCDAHAFAESGGATAFLLNLRLDGEPGQIILRMSTEGARNAIGFAKASCGSLTTMDTTE